MDISNPRRILVLSRPDTSIAPVLSALLPSTVRDVLGVPDEERYHDIKTPYYTARVPVWIDAIDDPHEWAQTWLDMDGAEEVVEAVGAWIIVFERPTDNAGQLRDIKKALSNLLENVSSVIRHHSDDASHEAVRLAIALPRTAGTATALVPWERLEEACRADDPAESWELVDAAAPNGTNEYGEKQGLARLREALETGEWDAGPPAAAAGDDDDDDVDHSAAGSDHHADGRAPRRAGAEGLLGAWPAADDAQAAVPILGAPNGGDGRAGGEKEEDEEDDGDALQPLVARLQAARDLGADLPAAERRRLAARAVREVLGEL